jgi:hypothetical protein
MPQTFTCPSTDGKFTVVYGAEWDSAIAISQESLKGNASFATIAANPEVNGSKTAYDYSAAGYTTTDDWRNANSTQLKSLSTKGLTVDNYSQFDSDFGTATAAATKMVALDPPEVIGYSPVGTTDIEQGLVKGFALMYIAKGRTCDDAKKACPIKGDWVDFTVRGVYLQMSNKKSDCDPKADAGEQAAAAFLLKDIVIKKP